jgi:hypothetical protein
MERKETSFKGYIISAVVVALVVVTSYFYQFGVYPLPIENTDWGTFGDFVGGTLNPFFAFMAFLALLTTIRIQSNELELTRDELSKSSNALESQVASIKQQNFENTFFKMIDVYNSIILDLSLEKFSNARVFSDKFNVSFLGYPIFLNENIDTKERETIKRLLDILNVYKRVNNTKDYQLKYDNFHNYYEDKIGHYFGFLYQILKFIKESDIENKKKYSSLFRSLFSKSELALLAHHCLGRKGSKRFKELVEFFEFFEHLPINSLDDNLVLMYDKSVFGKNEQWMEKIEKLKAKNELTSLHP